LNISDRILHSAAQPCQSTEILPSVVQRKVCFMRRSWVCILSCAWLLTLVSADVASAKKSRSSRATSRGQVPARRAYVARATTLATRERERKTYAVHGRRGRRLARSRGRSRRIRASGSCRFWRPAARARHPAERVKQIQRSGSKGGYMTPLLRAIRRRHHRRA